MIQKIDLAKYLILKRYGGVYVDMDMECKASIEEIFQKNPEIKVMVGEIKVCSNAKDKGCFPLLILTGGKKGAFYNNAIMASVREHPLWSDVIAKVKEKCSNHWFQLLRRCAPDLYISYTTGPSLFTEVLRSKWISSPDVLVAPPSYFEPCHKYEEKCDVTSAYAVHHYENSWMSPPMKLLTYAHYHPALTIGIITLILLIIVWVVFLL